jgi:hypothetical protein
MFMEHMLLELERMFGERMFKEHMLAILVLLQVGHIIKVLNLKVYLVTEIS